ncbi:MAG: alpha/beta hydrolase, partial [Anaerolineae bacterium]|nr:alpha/beta hydrolase [Anaerolineae bacterium]
ALCLLGLIFGILALGYGLAIAQVWEDAGLDIGVESGGWAWVEAQPIYYRTWGPKEGPWVVLIHGFQMEGQETWQANARVLGRWGMHVLAIDLKGFGHSFRDKTPTYSVRQEALILAQVLNQLRVQKATIVAHGWGSAVALQLAYEQPQFVDRLVLISPLVFHSPPCPWRPAARSPWLNRSAAWLFDAGGPLWRARQGQAFYDRSFLTPTYLRRVRQPTHIVGTLDALVAMALSSPEDDLPEALLHISAPTLILLGERDRLSPPGEGQRLQAGLPSAQLVIIPEAGHYVHIERATEVNHYIADFCLQHTP